MKNKPSTIEQDLEKEFLKYCRDFIIKLSYTDERYLLSFISSLLQKQRTKLIDEIVGLCCEVVHKEKHEDINGVYVNENEPNYLVDCSSTEAKCYNSGAVDQSIFIKTKLIDLKEKV